jgi:hypothetical protein
VIAGTEPFDGVATEALLFGIETAELLGVAFELLDSDVVASEDEECPGRDALLVAVSELSDFSEELLAGAIVERDVLLQSASK